jgi:hypothetical protein
MNTETRTKRPVRDRCAPFGMGLWLSLALLAMALAPLAEPDEPAAVQTAGVIDDIIDVIEDLLGGGDDEEEEEEEEDVPLPDPEDGN